MLVVKCFLRPKAARLSRWFKNFIKLIFIPGETQYSAVRKVFLLFFGLACIFQVCNRTILMSKIT